jgi:carbon-monoxide dehydrogenase small subunit
VKRRVLLRVNGEKYEVLIKPSYTLLEVLRNELKLTGTKEACGIGACGACTVLVKGKPVNSCITLAVEADGDEILTIEGLTKEGRLHPLQKTFIDHHAFQCGFCTPGMIMTAKALLDRNPEPTEDEIRSAISGNLCRCTGYMNIIKAISSTVKETIRKKTSKTDE